MTDETNAAPTAEQIAAARTDAEAIVASSVADLITLIAGANLLTLAVALDIEKAKGDAARKGAVAALESAINGHPELAASAVAAAADDNPALAAEHDRSPIDTAFESFAPTPIITGVLSDDRTTVQILVDGEPHGEPIPLTASPAPIAENDVKVRNSSGTGCSYRGKSYEADENGCIRVPLSALGELASFGFGRVG